jgi:hypothetical protein
MPKRNLRHLRNLRIKLPASDFDIPAKSCAATRFMLYSGKDGAFR